MPQAAAIRALSQYLAQAVETGGTSTMRVNGIRCVSKLMEAVWTGRPSAAPPAITRLSVGVLGQFWAKAAYVERCRVNQWLMSHDDVGH